MPIGESRRVDENVADDDDDGNDVDGKLSPLRFERVRKGFHPSAHLCDICIRQRIGSVQFTNTQKNTSFAHTLAANLRPISPPFRIHMRSCVSVCVCVGSTLENIHEIASIEPSVVDEARFGNISIDVAVWHGRDAHSSSVELSLICHSMRRCCCVVLGYPFRCATAMPIHKFCNAPV